jgi:hypothetical protein
MKEEREYIVPFMVRQNEVVEIFNFKRGMRRLAFNWDPIGMSITWYNMTRYDGVPGRMSRAPSVPACFTHNIATAGEFFRPTGKVLTDKELLHLNLYGEVPLWVERLNG